jgi:tRNA 2-thiouridine synthesizing protein A
MSTSNAETRPADAILDAGESGCGELVMLIFEQMKTLAAGQTLLVYAHDVAAETDIAAWCRSTGNQLLASDLSSDPMRFWIQKSGS